MDLFYKAVNGRSLEWDARQPNNQILGWQFLFGTISIRKMVQVEALSKTFGEVLDKGSVMGLVKSLGKGSDW